MGEVLIGRLERIGAILAPGTTQERPETVSVIAEGAWAARTSKLTLCASGLPDSARILLQMRIHCAGHMYQRTSLIQRRVLVYYLRPIFRVKNHVSLRCKLLKALPTRLFDLDTDANRWKPLPKAMDTSKSHIGYTALTKD